MTTRTRSFDRRFSRTYGKWAPDFYGTMRYWTVTNTVGPYWTKQQSGTDQLGGVKSAPRARRPRDKVIARGRRALDPHPYTMSVDEGVYNTYEVIHPQYTFVTTTIQPKASLLGHIPVDPAQEYRVINKLRKRAYGSDWNPAVFAAEMPEALNMIGSSAMRIRRGLLCAAGGDWRGVVKNFGEPTPKIAKGAKSAIIDYNEGRMILSKLWLEISYGWKPLLGDIESACAFIADALNGPGTKRNRISAKREWEESDWALPSAKEVVLARRTTRYFLKYTITELKSSPIYLPSLATVATVAWEKLPYSFVCDWVVPVGDYLAALRTAADLQGTVVRSLKRTTTWDMVRAGPGTSTRSMDADFSFSKRLTSLDRTVTKEISPPVPVGDLSPSSIFSSVERTLNAVALLQNLRLTEPTGKRRIS